MDAHGVCDLWLKRDQGTFQEVVLVRIRAS
jgi:hypothetical protein